MPAVTTAASGRLYKKGLLIKVTALEWLAQIDTVVFDKTGTLTNGLPQLVELPKTDAISLQIAASLASASMHPLSVALSKALTESGTNMANLTGVEEIPGYGVQGYFGGRLVKLGRAEWVGADAIDETATYLRLWEMEPITFAFQDALRDGAFELLKDIQHQVGDVHILSGDSRAPCRCNRRSFASDKLCCKRNATRQGCLHCSFASTGKKCAYDRGWLE